MSKEAQVELVDASFSHSLAHWVTLNNETIHMHSQDTEAAGWPKKEGKRASCLRKGIMLIS